MSRMNALSRKDFRDQESVRLWMLHLSEECSYGTLYDVSSDKNGPLLVSCMSLWQKSVCNYSYITLFIILMLI